MRTTLTLTVTSPDRRFSLEARVLVHDSGDLNVVVSGGRDHAGAVALAIPRSSLADPAARSATSSVLTVPGHKDDLPAREISERLAAATGHQVIVAAGIHYDGLQSADLEILQKLWLALAEKIAAKLDNH